MVEPHRQRVEGHDAKAILNELQHMRAQFGQEHVQNTTNIKTVQIDLAQALAEIKKLKAAFPGDDPEGHRRYHESVIEWRELRNRMIREALLQAGKVGGLGALGWIAYAVWIAIKMEVTK